MIVTFCGHSDYSWSEKDEQIVLNFLNDAVGNSHCDFFLGEYGNFDAFGYKCAEKYKRTHKNCKLVYITPYNTSTHLNNYKKVRFDLIIYPELETIPPRYAISHRNRWIAEQTDIVIAYISHKYGGAYTTYLHAKRKNKLIINLADIDQ